MTVSAGSLYAKARNVVGLSFADGRLDDNNLAGALSIINTGLSEFCLDKDWPFLYSEGTISVVAGTEGYNLPSNHVRTLWLAIDTYLLSQKQRRQAAFYFDTQDRPQFYSEVGTQILLAPVPDANYTMRIGYYTVIPEVTAVSISALDGVSLAIPDYLEGLASLYIAKQIALMFKDKAAYDLVSEDIRTQKQRIDDTARAAVSPMTPNTRQDF